MFELATKWVQPSKFYGINSLIVLFYVIQVVATAIPTCEAKISEYKLKKSGRRFSLCLPLQHDTEVNLTRAES